MLSGIDFLNRRRDGIITVHDVRCWTVRCVRWRLCRFFADQPTESIHRLVSAKRCFRILRTQSVIWRLCDDRLLILEMLTEHREFGRDFACKWYDFPRGVRRNGKRGHSTYALKYNVIFPLLLYLGHSCSRHSPATIALSNGCRGTTTFASTSFHGQATDMNVHPSAPVRAFDWKGASPFMG